MSGIESLDEILPGSSPAAAVDPMNGSVEQARARFIGRRRAAVTVVASFTLLAVACAIAGVLAWRDVAATAAVADARQARRSGTLVLEAVLIAESEQRGYLLMRDPSYLARYNDAKTEYAQALAELRQHLSDRPRRIGQIATAARIGGEKFAELDQTVALGQRGQFDAALEVVRSGAGKALMGELHRIMEDLTADANYEVEQTTANQKWLSTLLIGAIVFALLAVAGLGVVLLKNVRLHLALLETRAASDRQLADTLEGLVAQRTRELLDANQRFNAALRSSGVTVMTQDRDLVFTWVSRGIFGKTPREIVGKPQREVIPEATPGAATNLKRTVIETGEPARGDIRIVYDGSETWVRSDRASVAG